MSIQSLTTLNFLYFWLMQVLYFGFGHYEKDHPYAAVIVFLSDNDAVLKWKPYIHISLLSKSCVLVMIF